MICHAVLVGAGHTDHTPDRPSCWQKVAKLPKDPDCCVMMYHLKEEANVGWQKSGRACSAGVMWQTVAEMAECGECDRLWQNVTDCGRTQENVAECDTNIFRRVTGVHEEGENLWRQIWWFFD